jgi:hypothetical protein
MMPLPEAAYAPRSRFVSIIAWLGIVSGCFATLSGVLIVRESPHLSSFGILAGGIMAVVAGLGLRRRRNWARLSFIAVQALAIVQSFARLVSQPAIIERQLSSSGVSAADAKAAAATLPTMFLVMTLAFSLINALIIAKLCSRRVREEFEAETGS